MRVEHAHDVAIPVIMNDKEKASVKKMILVSLWSIQSYPSKLAINEYSYRESDM